MRFAFTDDQLLFRDTVRELFTKECPPARIRDAWDGDGQLPELWSSLAEMGVTGLLVPEDCGGLGLQALDLVLLLEEAGRAGVPGPLVDTVAVAPVVLAAARGAADVEGWLAGIADGSALVATGFGSPLVEQADVATVLLLESGTDIVAVAPADATLVPQPSVDGARRLFEVRWSSSAQVSLPSREDGLERAFEAGALATSAVLLGLADRMLELTVGYVKEREQFGVPIGSFQAIKHHLADALLAVSFARPVVHRAAYSVSHDLPTRARDVSMAKAYASDAATLVGRQALQCHGAIGYTVEHDLHLYLKRAWALAASWGDASWHRDRVGSALGI